MLVGPLLLLRCLGATLSPECSLPSTQCLISEKFGEFGEFGGVSPRLGLAQVKLLSCCLFWCVENPLLVLAPASSGLYGMDPRGSLPALYH